jgi:hypothetical protein
MRFLQAWFFRIYSKACVLTISPVHPIVGIYIATKHPTVCDQCSQLASDIEHYIFGVHRPKLGRILTVRIWYKFTITNFGENFLPHSIMPKRASLTTRLSVDDIASMTQLPRATFPALNTKIPLFSALP